MILDLITTTITVFGGIVTYLLGRFLYEEYRKPTLEILREDTIPIPNEKYHRIIVRNSGRTAAENCAGNIHLFGKDATGNNVDVTGGVCWAIIGNPSIITVNVEDEQALDIYRVVRPQPGLYTFELPTEKGWSALRLGGRLRISNFADPAKLLIEIRITAKNAKPTKKTYSLRRQGSDVVLEEVI